MSVIDVRPIGAAAARDQRSALAAPVAGTMIAVAILVPRSTPLCLAVLVLTLASIAFARGTLRIQELIRPDWLATPLLALASLAMLSSLWAAAPGTALAPGAGTALIVLLAWLGAHALPPATTPDHLRLMRGLLIGYGIAIALLAFEMATAQTLHRLVYNLVPELRPHASEYFERAGQVVKIRGEQINRSIAVAALMLWPMLLLMMATRQRAFYGGGLAGAVCGLVLAGPHESSKFALALGMGVAAAAMMSRRWALRTVLAAWLTSALLIVPLAQGAFALRLYEITALQDSARARLILWGYTAGEIPKAPLLGIGAGVGRVLDDQRESVAERLPGQPHDLRTGSHQHNIFLQAWYELGLAGAILLAISGATLILRAGRAEAASTPHKLAAIAAALGMISVSYGLWQAWFQAALAWPMLVALLWTKHHDMIVDKAP